MGLRGLWQGETYPRRVSLVNFLFDSISIGLVFAYSCHITKHERCTLAPYSECIPNVTNYVTVFCNDTDGLQVKTHRGTQKSNLCFSGALPFTLIGLWNVVSDALSQSFTVC
jgi:hypothetical protein